MQSWVWDFFEEIRCLVESNFISHNASHAWKYKKLNIEWNRDKKPCFVIEPIFSCFVFKQKNTKKYFVTKHNFLPIIMLTLCFINHFYCFRLDIAFLLFAFAITTTTTTSTNLKSFFIYYWPLRRVLALLAKTDCYCFWQSRHVSDIYLIIILHEGQFRTRPNHCCLKM